MACTCLKSFSIIHFHATTRKKQRRLANYKEIEQKCRICDDGIGALTQTPSHWHQQTLIQIDCDVWDVLRNALDSRAHNKLMQYPFVYISHIRSVDCFNMNGMLKSASFGRESSRCNAQQWCIGGGGVESEDY